MTDNCKCKAKPSWLKTDIPRGSAFFNIKRELKKRNIVTVCEEARCPNIGECWSKKTATFMVLGRYCTRNCKFCGVEHRVGKLECDANEKYEIASAVKLMDLKYSVITMVTRDDLVDGGAEHLSSVIREIRSVSSDIVIEVLTSDFAHNIDAIKTVVMNEPNVFSHNIETVERLTSLIRDKKFSYQSSIEVLKNIKKISKGSIVVKSGFMVGLGETQEDIEETLKDLKDAGVEIVTIGQYLRPSPSHYPVKLYYTPEQFKDLEKLSLSLGFKGVAAGPLVRSSFKASEVYSNL